MKIELKQRITHNGVLYDPGVHDLPADLCEEFMAKGRWVAAPLQKIKLIHPIIHDGTEYGRGIHELPESLVAHFLTTASQYPGYAEIRRTSDDRGARSASD